MPFNWEHHRRADRSIDLVSAFRAQPINPSPSVRRAIDFLTEVEDMTLIHSRQAAAVAVAQANEIATRR